MNKQEAIEEIKNLKGLTILDKTINFDSEMIPKKKVLNIVKQLDEPEKPVVPQFVADWYEENKENFDKNLFTLIYNIVNAYTMDDLTNYKEFTSLFEDWMSNDFKRWMSMAYENGAITTLVNMNQFGYEVEKDKLYRVELPKFRFFGKVADGEKRMVLADYIDFKNEFVCYHYHVYTIEGGDHMYGDVIGFEDGILMQSTGLKDNNGKEIYDGDIVRFTLKDGFSYVIDEEGVVTYKLGAFYILNGLTEYLISNINTKDIEVVGNIYENPELLEGE